MSKKDYVLIATALRRAHMGLVSRTTGPAMMLSRDGLDDIMTFIRSRLMSALHDDNPRFDGNAFDIAATFEDDK